MFDLPTYRLIDADKKRIKSKIYEPKTMRILEKEVSNKTIFVKFLGCNGSFPNTLVSSASNEQFP